MCPEVEKPGVLLAVCMQEELQTRECGPQSVRPVGRRSSALQGQPFWHLLCRCSQLPLPAESSPDTWPRLSTLPSLDAPLLILTIQTDSTTSPLHASALCFGVFCLLPPDHHTPSPLQSSRPLPMVHPWRNWPFPAAGTHLTLPRSPASGFCFSEA